MDFSFNKKTRDHNFSRKNEEIKKDTSYSRLYMDFYNFKKPPFSITPDPEFLYSSSSHKAAIEKILYGIKACMGFILLIGEVGTGKTTLCRAILDKLEGDAETVYIINPSLSGIEIIQAILDDLGLDYPPGLTKKSLLDRLNRYLLDVTTEKPVVIIIDDAQTMTQEGLENLRLLSNLETDKKKLLQLVLVGQQELQVLLSQHELRQLKQRITICCQLNLIGYADLKHYILLRLFIAGDNGKINFSEPAIKEIYKASKGIPRLINLICDYALTSGYVSDSYIIKKEHVRSALNELRHQSLVDKTYLSGLFTYPKEKRVWLELLILFIGVIFFTFVHGEKILDKKPQLMVVQPESKALHISGPPDSVPENNLNNAGVFSIENIRKDSSEIEDELSVSDEIKDIVVEAPENYIIQICSVKTLKAAIQEGLSLRQRGLDVHWNTVHFKKNGIWYRIYQGGFSTKREAMAFREEKGITKGIIIHAPWTMLVSSRNQVETPEDVYSFLQEKGLDCILEKDGDTGYRVTAGAFKSFERAQKASRDILDMGLDAKPILR